MQELLIYGAPALTFGLGYFIAKRGVKPNNDGYWEAKLKGAKLRRDHWLDEAQRCANSAIEYRKQRNEAIASVERLTDVLAAKNERLERIAEHGRNSKSGAAVHLAKIAEGVA